MFPSDLQKILKQSPFKPIRLVGTDGARFEVRHPEFCIVGVTSTVVFTPSEQNPALWDNWVHLDNEHIIRAEYLSVPAGAAQNGTG